MGIDNFADYDGIGLAQLVATHAVTPLELVDAAIARIEKHNPTLNAVVWTMFDRARDLARAPLPDGPFAGVPFLLKDSLGDLDGAPTREASALEPARLRTVSANLTKRFLAAGVIPLGKTNIPEFSLLPTTESRLYGPAHNPWNLSFSTGGSSGGAAAAVAAGIVPMAHANDSGGSIRIPASCCGLVGLKPTRARTSLGPGRGEGWGPFTSEHIVCRSVRDSATMLDATAGGVAGDPYWAPVPTKPWRTSALEHPGRLRIAIIRDRSDGSTIHKDCITAVDNAAALCRDLGHATESVALPVVWHELVEAYTVIYATSVVTWADQLCQAQGIAPSSNNLEGYTLGVYALGKSFSATQYQRALEAVYAAGRTMAIWHETYDVALSATMGTPPMALGSLDIAAMDITPALVTMAEYMPFTALANATGQPAISLPLHINDAGLPIGVQFSGRYGDEATLLQLATQIEAAAPWASRHPPIWN